MKYGISPIVVVCCIVSGYKCYYLRQRYFTDYWEVRADNICITAPISYMGFIEKVLQWASPEKFQRIEKALDNVVVNEATVDSLHIVYVIGESCIKDRLGVYGYFLDTTPFIQQEFDRGNIVLLNDVVTPTPQTVVMMPRLMTVADIDNTPDINDYPLLPGVLKKGGYYVEYYDNQSIKKTTAAFDYACNSFMMKPSIQRKAVDSINDTKFRYDMDLVHNYKVAMDSCRTFTIYHLWGQHLEKEMVCDPELARFEAEDYSVIPEYDQVIRQRQATYDNKILETDKTIQLIIEQLRESIALLVFVPDHGEEMFDSRMSFGRTIGDHSLSALRSAHNVPAFIWLSDSYIAKYPDIKDRLQAAADKKIYNCDIPFTILDLSTVGTPEISRHPSLLNPSPGRKARILDDTFNYDAVEDDVRKLRLYYSGL